MVIGFHGTGGVDVELQYAIRYLSGVFQMGLR